MMALVGGVAVVLFGGLYISIDEFFIKIKDCYHTLVLVYDMENAAWQMKHGTSWLEYGPLLLFFITNYFKGIMWGTAVLVSGF